MEKVSMRHGLMSIVKGSAEFWVAFGKHVNDAVIAKPWVAVLFTALLIGAISSSYMLQCRAERNTTEAELVHLQMQYDSIKACYDIK